MCFSTHHRRERGRVSQPPAARSVPAMPSAYHVQPDPSKGVFVQALDPRCGVPVRPSGSEGCCIPRYFFNMMGGPYPDPDERIDLKGPEQACSQAVTTIGEMLRNIDGHFWAAPEWHMHVTDDQGANVCTFSMTGAISKG
jgi:hypothetical protein